MSEIHVLALDATRQGGAGVYTTRLVKELAQRGHRVTLICHEALGEVRNFAEVHEIARVPTSRPFGLWRLASLLQLGDYRVALRQLPLSRPDMAIVSAQPLGWAYARQYPGVGLVYLPHSLVAPLELASYPYTSKLARYAAIQTYDYLERDCLRRSATTVRFTQTAASAFRTHYGQALSTRLRVLPMPIDVPDVEHRPAGPVPRLLTVGRLIPSKNIGLLVELLGERRHLPWHLDVVGSGPMLAPLQAAIRDARLDDRISMHGHCDDVAAFYRRADAFLFPSLLENSPVVLLEAMSFALPSLSLHPDEVRIHGANNEIVEHGVTGLLARDEQEFGTLLSELLSEKFDLYAMGRAAHHAVRQRNSWSDHVANLESLIHIHQKEAA